MLTINSVNKSYLSGRVQALKNVSLSFPDKGFVAIVGESGSGKSTLLNVLGGIDKADSGTIEFELAGKKYNYNKNKERQILYRDYYTYVLQENIYVAEMNLRDNIKLAQTVSCGEFLPEDEAKMAELLCTTKLDERLEHNFKKVSGGQRQRATLVRGVLKNASVIFADEPTASQDETSERRVFEILRNEASEKLVIMVTHSKKLAYEYCDRIIELNNGECVHDDRVNHNDESNIEIVENNVIVENPAQMSEKQWERISSAVIEHGRIVLELKHPKNAEDNHADTAEREPKPLSCSKRKSNYKWAVFCKILKYNAYKMVLFAFALSILIAISLFVRDISVEKASEIARYEMAKSNHLKEWFFLQRGHDDMSGVAESYAERTGKMCEPLVIKDLRFDEIKSSPYLDGVDFISGIRVYVSENKTFIYGEARNDALAITDFLADAVIKQSDDYTTYQDFIDKGLKAAGKKIPISGIIATDYKEYTQYINLAKIDETARVKRNEFVDRRDKCYNMLYMTKDMYNQLKNGRENPYVIFGAENHFFITVKVDNKLANSDNNQVSINQAFYELTDGVIGMWSFGLSFNLETTLIDDGSDIPTIYVDSKLYKDPVNYGFNLSNFITEAPEDFSQYVELREYASFISHLDQETDKYLSFTRTMRDLYNNSKLIIAVIMCIVLTMIPGAFAKSLKKTVGLCKLWGASFKNVLSLELLFGTVETITVVVSYFIVEALVTLKGSSILSKSFGLTLDEYLSLDISSVARFALYEVLAAFLLTIVITLIRYKTRISKQLFD